jgi:hypothetical protein
VTPIFDIDPDRDIRPGDGGVVGDLRGRPPGTTVETASPAIELFPGPASLPGGSAADAGSSLGDQVTAGPADGTTDVVDAPWR